MFPKRVFAFPVGALPPVVGRFVREAAESIGCPPDLVALPALAALGASIGNARIIGPKRSWTESAAIFGAAIAPSGQKKTAAMSAALGPIKAEQRAMNRAYAKAVEDHAREMRTWKRDAADCRKAGEPEPPEPPPPVWQKALIGDTTVEAIVPALRDNPRGALQHRDEIVGWINSFDQYRSGKGSDRQFYLSAWSHEPYDVMRKGHTGLPLAVPRPFMCVVGGIQPAVLPDLSGNVEDGMLERFLLVYPDPVSAMYTDAEITDAARFAYEDLHDRLRTLHLDADDQGDPMPVFVGFAPDAKDVWRDINDAHRAEMASPWFQPHLDPAWSKLEAYMLRLTLICACCRFALDDAPQRVEVDDVRRAHRLREHFKNHARRAHAALKDEDDHRRLLEDVAAFVAEHGGEWSGTPSELHESLESDHKTGGVNTFTARLGKAVKRHGGITYEPPKQTRPQGGGNPKRVMRLGVQKAILGNIGTPSTAST